MNVAVLVASPVLPRWQADAIAGLRAIPELRVRVVAVPAPAWRPPRGLAARLAGSALAPAAVPIDAELAADAQLVLDLTGTAPPYAAEHGTWSFRAGDADDAIPFARAIASGASTVEVVLERRTADGVAVLRRGRFGVTRWHPTTVRIALREAARWPAILAGALAAGIPVRAEPAAPASPSRAASAPDRLRFGVALARRLGAAIAEQLFEITEWNVGLARGDARSVLAGAPLDVAWLPVPAPWTFLADPFLVERDGRRVLFAEEYDYRRDRGVLEALELDAGGEVVRRERILDLPTHLSYPYPIEIDGALYLLPENCAARDVALYRCVEFPARWERERALLPDFDGVDTSLFRHDGRWWTLGTRYGDGSMLALHAFHADDPRGPWVPHPLNPVVVDVAGARPAGAPFVVDGVLYRPAQDCSRTYGGAVAIARIDELTPSAYRETVVARLEPLGAGRYREGIHTLGFCGGTIVVDGKRTYRDPRKAWWFARRLAAKLARRAAQRTRIAAAAGPRREAIPASSRARPPA